MASVPSHRSYLIGPVLRVFFAHVKRYRLLTIALTIMRIAYEAIHLVALPYVAKRLFDVLAAPPTGQSGIDGPVSVVLFLAGTSVAAWVVLFFLFRGYSYLVPRMMADLEQTSFRYMLGHSYQFFQNNFSGSLVRRITRIAKAFEELYDAFDQKLLPIVVSFTGILMVLFHRSTQIGLIVLVWITVMMVYNYLYARWKVGYDIKRAEQDSRCTGFLSDTISNELTIKLFAANKREVEGYEHESNTLRNMRLHIFKSHLTNHSVQAMILIVIQVFVLWLGIRAWSEGRLTAGDIILFQSYFAILSGKLLDFSRLIRTCFNSFADATEMVEILDQPHEIQDVRGAKALRIGKGRVQFDQVDFSYGTANVLNKFELDIKPGEKIALVGTSGAGKSTVVKLLFRFYDVTKGAILIDGQDVRKVTQDSLRSSIALVPQEPILFHRSLLDNIRYGRPNASLKEVIKAAKLAHCHAFIDRLPEKYDTHVGERGVKLSGGERQRVAIARAILKNAPILVLDEATSSLDSESEGLIQDALRTLMKDKTTIVIAHRLSTIMSMDRIVIMDKGRVTDTGTHAELVQQAGIYQKLWNLQVGGFFQDA